MGAAPRLIHIISSTSWGEREQYALDICRGFADAGWDVTAYTRDAGAVDNPLRQAGIRVRHLSLSGYSDVSTILRLAHAFRRKGSATTVVHAHTIHDAFVALAARKLVRRKQVRVVLTCHSVKPCRNTPLRRRTLRNLHALIFPSALTRDLFLSPWSPVEPPLATERVHVLHTGVYLPLEPEREEAAGPTVAAYFGRLVPGKGLETFIRALPSLRGRRLRACIAGSGDPDYLDSLKHLAFRLEVMDMIDWSGRSLPREQVARRAHIGVFPSLEPEAFGPSCALFMAYGRPVVCTHSGAQSEYVTNGREGLLVPPADPQALSEALLSLAADADRRRAMGAAAAARYEADLAWPRLAGTLRHIYLD